MGEGLPLRNAGMQESYVESGFGVARTRLMSSFDFVKLRMRPWFRPTAFRYEPTMAKWVGVSS